jgi:branched-chain amino acid transport system permease protein
LLDGLTNGAVYALLGLATVLVFAVTRVIFIPQGEFVTYGALTLAILQTGQVPGTVWLLMLLALLAALAQCWQSWQRHPSLASAGLAGVRVLALPVVIALVTLWAAPLQFSLLVQATLSVAIVTCFGPLVYRLHQSLADASSLVLLIVGGVHFALTGLGLLFSAPGFRNPPFWDARFQVGAVSLTGQALIVALASTPLMVLLWLFFERTLYGKALRATAINRTGARLMGISSQAAGQLTLACAALIGALSGLLIGPTTTVFYDGFLIGLKGFVAAVIGGLASYPGAALGALLVGVIEAFGSFWASAFKEVIVFTLILPVLLWRSLTSGHQGEEH